MSTSSFSQNSVFQSWSNYLGITTEKKDTQRAALLKFALLERSFQLEKIFEKFFQRSFYAKPIGIIDGSLDPQRWKGISSHWSSEEQKYQLKLDRELVFLCLSVFGEKSEQQTNFSFSTLSKIEREILQGLFLDLIEEIEALGLTSEESESKIFLIWLIEKENQQGKIAIEFPESILEQATFLKLSSEIKKRTDSKIQSKALEQTQSKEKEENKEKEEDELADIFSESEESESEEKSEEKEEQIESNPEETGLEEEDFAEKIILETDLVVGSAKLMLKEIYRLEQGDLIILEESKKGYFYFPVEREQKLFEVPVEVSEKTRSFELGSDYFRANK